MRIKEDAPELVTPDMVMADKIASIAVPKSGGSIWEALSGAFSVAGPKTAGGLGARISTPHKTKKLKKLKNRLLDQYTRGEQANRFGVRLPSLGALGAPQRGIATASRFRHMPEEQYVEEAVEGGVGAAAATGDTQFVDDKGWPVTLKQILGSRLLTSEMYEKASIHNVSKLINVRGGTQEQNEEMKYMFQRMMLEGFIRGVDITKELERQGGLDLTIGKYETIGVHKYVNGQPTVIFKDSWWNDKTDADKYTLFVHEVGHSLLNAHHENDRSQKVKDPGRLMTPIYAGSVLRDYDNLMDGLFKESTSYNRINVSEQTTPQQYDPSWFPALAELAPGTPDTEPKEEKQVGSTIVTPTVHGGAASTTQTSITAGNGPAVANLGATPVAGGELSSSVQTPTKTFAAGMANLSVGGADMQQAGALLKSG